MRMLKKILFISGLCIVLGMIALAVLFSLFTNPKYLKAQLVEQVAANTGRQIQINGPIHWTFSEQLGISLDDVVLKQPLAFDPHSSGKAERVDLMVAWRPLLSRQVRIEKMKFHNLAVSFTQNFPKKPAKVNVHGDLQVDMPRQRAVMEPLRIDSGAIHMTGQVIAEKIFKDAQISGQLQLPQLDLAHGLAPLIGDAPLSGALHNILIHFHSVSKQSIVGDIAADRLAIDRFSVARLRAKFFADMNKIQLTAVHAILADGSVSGQVSMMDWRKSPRYQIDAMFSHVELSHLLQSGILTGPANASVHLTALGATAAELLAHLNGSLQLDVENGVLNHLDLLQQIRAVRQFLQANPSVAAAAGVTHFSHLTASGAIQEGLFNNNDFVLQSPDLQATGAGTINLVDKQIKYDLLVKIQARAMQDIYGISVPLKITGTLDKPKIKMDFISIQPSPDLNKQLGKALHNELKVIFHHH